MGFWTERRVTVTGGAGFLGSVVVARLEALGCRIKELVSLIAEITGYRGTTAWDTARLDGQPQRSLDTSRAKAMFGFEARTGLEAGRVVPPDPRGVTGRSWPPRIWPA